MSFGRLAPVAWHDDQLVGPADLVYADESVRRRLAVERGLVRPEAWGLDRLDLDPDALAAGTVRVRRLRAVLSDGRLLDVPGDTVVPPVDVRGDAAGPGPWRLELEAPAAEAPADPPPVALAAPDDAWQRSPLDGGDSAAGIDPIDLPDVEVRVRRARLRVVSAAAAAGPGIPIARLLPAEEPGDPGLRLADGGFLPPLLTLRAAPGLRRRLDELARLLESALETARAGRGGTGPADLADPTGARRFLRAWELSGARAAIRWLADTPEAAPFEAWRTLRRLADRLDFLEGRIAGDPPAWRHETPGPALEEVLDRLRAHLWGTESVFVELLPFRRSDLGWSASPLPGHAASAALYLCVSGGGPEESVVEFVEDPDRFKLLPSGALGPSGAAGLRLRHARVVPDALAAAGRRAVHFRIVDLERKRDYWNRLLRGEPPGIQIRNDGGLAVDRGFEMRLAIVPADEGGRA